MSKDPAGTTPAKTALKRLNELLEELTEEGWTQQQIALQAGLTPALLSDLKQGHRTLSELAARRLAEQHKLSHKWLLGLSEVKRPAATGALVGGTIWLPVFAQPIEGEPRSNACWDGSAVEVSGAAVAQLARAEDPYLLRYGANDVGGRLHQGDLILVSQSTSAEAELHVVKYRSKLFLARLIENGSYERCANGNKLSAACPRHGYCLGVIWSSLVN